MSRRFLFFLFLLFNVGGYAQSRLRIGEWKDHTSFQRIKSLTKSNDAVYAASDIGILKYDLKDNSVSQIGRVQGLSDLKISLIDFDENSNTLVVAYENGNIDLIKGREITNIPDIVAKGFIGSSKINEISIQDNSTAYFATDFGIVLVDLKTGFSLESYLFNSGNVSLAALDVAVYRDSLFASTNGGVFKAPLNNQAILADFSRWQQERSLPKFDKAFNQIEVYGDYLIVNYFSNQYPNDSLYYKSSNADWQRLDDAFFYQNRRLRVYEGKLLLANHFATYVYDENLNRLRTLNPNFGIFNEFFDCLLLNDKAWMGFSNSGLVTEAFGDFAPIDYNGPFYNVGFKLNEGPGNTLFATTGGYNAQYSNNFNNRGFYSYQNGQWKNYNHLLGSFSDSIVDLVSVTGVSTNKFYVNSWGDGLLEFENGSFKKIHWKDNSPLEVRVEFNSQINVGFSKLDLAGNLWVSNSYTDELFKVLRPDQTWLSVDIGSAYGAREKSTVTDFIITSSGALWITQGDKGLYVFHPGADISNPTDYQSRKLGTTESTGGLPDLQVFDLVEDLDGDIWIGTSKGPAVFYNPDFIFEDPSESAQQIFIEQDGNVQIVLETEQINAIEVDGGNRKWFGTQSSGVFVFSPDVSEQIAHFTSENSPLLSNQITDIEIINNTGEVFISSSAGIQSFKSDATQGAESAKTLNVYPNPIRPDYQGNLTIDGFVAESKLKITSSDGRLVQEVESLGGRATWNLKNYDGSPVGSGVYLILSTNEDGSEVISDRVLVIRN